MRVSFFLTFKLFLIKRHWDIKMWDNLYSYEIAVTGRTAEYEIFFCQEIESTCTCKKYLALLKYSNPVLAKKNSVFYFLLDS